MQFDVSIQGAGPVGCTLALLLHQQGRSVVLVQHRKQVSRSFRPIALSHASRLILERVGAWPALAPTPITTVHVSQRGAFGRTRLCAADADVPALGYVLDYRFLLNALLDLVAEKRIPFEPPRATPQLLVHAEGTADEIAKKDYGQEAVVALVTTRPAAAGTAWERFTPEGPLALLPLGGRYCTVWGTSPRRAEELCAAPETEFLRSLAKAFGRRAGEFTAVGERNRLPLALRVRARRTGERTAYIGNAAQTLHPVAGQGLNLGLRDAWDLAQVLRCARDAGEASVLRRFAAMRRFDASATVRVTDFLAGAFLGADPLAAVLRGFALTALDSCVPARRFFARRMIYGASALP